MKEFKVFKTRDGGTTEHVRTIYAETEDRARREFTDYIQAKVAEMDNYVQINEIDELRCPGNFEGTGYYHIDDLDNPVLDGETITEYRVDVYIYELNLEIS